MHAPWIVAHRGAAGHAPENTMAGFRRAVELGARFIETDLHLTRDARFVAIHDATLERTTNGKGTVRQHTLAELKQLDAGSWFSKTFMGQRIPTIEEILEYARQADVVFYLEIKPESAVGLQHSLVSVLRGAGEAARAVVLAWDPTLLQTMLKLESTIMTGFLFDRAWPDVVSLAQQTGARQIAPRMDLVTSELVQQAHEVDIHVVAWTANEPEEMRRLLELGVDGIMTDYPDRLQRVVEEAKTKG